MGFCMANLCASVMAMCANYQRIEKVQEGEIPQSGYECTEEVLVELEELPLPEPVPQERETNVKSPGEK